MVCGPPASCQISDSERGWGRHLALRELCLDQLFFLLGAVRSPCRFADQCWTVELKWWIGNHWSSIPADSFDTCSGSIFGEQTEEKEDEVLMVVVEG